ncbi:Bcr/CflA family efflux MFS transporter [Nonomuraea deserti]|uniref:Bcr/CflA family efflux MFS transporter n=1 Tax=Nonomuraea deserti TaxID=1848322 RepID=A0A4R4VSP4_9ACTN|nr:multidrug effflux MFS transporter [Nonomuraea deserti]TDD06263.1 Bcr/CflA family efflux MFS transporter [Nonomuraea deserti]
MSVDTAALSIRPARSERLRLILALGALVALGPLTVDMYLPALPAIVDDLHTTEPLVQLTLTGTLLGLGLGQLVIGPFSDAVGRRPPLIIGTGLHVITSVLSVFAWDITVLGVLRTVQGIGAAAATVVAMAVVRDLFEGRAAATVISRLMLVMGAAPVLAPSLGSAVLIAGSWRWVFGALALLGVVLIVVAAYGLPETLPPRRRRSGGVRQVLGAYRSILGDAEFVILALVAGLGFGAVFAYISGSAFVLQQQYGLDQQEFGLAFGLGALALVGGTQLNPVLLGRSGPGGIVFCGLAAATTAGLVLTVLQTAHIGGLAGFVVPLFCMLAAVALVLPNTPALALSRHGEAAGTAAAVLGALQFGLGSLLAPVVGVLGNDGPATAITMTGSIAIALLAFSALALRGRRTLAPQDAD